MPNVSEPQMESNESRKLGLSPDLQDLFSNNTHMALFRDFLMYMHLTGIETQENCQRMVTCLELAYALHGIYELPESASAAEVRRHLEAIYDRFLTNPTTLDHLWTTINVDALLRFENHITELKFSPGRS